MTLIRTHFICSTCRHEGMWHLFGGRCLRKVIDETGTRRRCGCERHVILLSA